MGDYRKWDRMYFDDSDSDSDTAEGTRGKVRHGQQLSHTPGRTGAHDVATGDNRIFEHAEVLSPWRRKCQGTAVRRLLSWPGAARRGRRERDGADGCRSGTRTLYEALEAYAGAVGDDHDEPVRALRKAAELLDLANISQRDVTSTLRKVGMLQDLTLALAKSGEYTMSQEELLDTIAGL